MGHQQKPVPYGTSFQPLLLSNAKQLLDHPYLSFEAGYGPTEDNMLHVAASTYMEGCRAEMVDWWFGFVHTTEQYKLWHPRDHVFSDWEGPRENKSDYIGGSHLVEEYIGGTLQKLIISFKDPSNYFGHDWKALFQKFEYGTAICGRVGSWNPETNQRVYTGHLIHLVKDEPGACRMRPQFWLGDIEGVPEPQGHQIPVEMGAGLLQHATEEMAILASKLPALFDKHSRKSRESP